MWLIVLVTLLRCASAYDVDVKKLDGLAKARVETCGGWQLNRLREVKAFVVQDIPLYHNLVMKHIPGADPELVLLNHYYEELDETMHSNGFATRDFSSAIERNRRGLQEVDRNWSNGIDYKRIALSDLTRSEINELLGKLGFYKKAQPEDEVPEEFRFSPAKDSPFKDESAGKPYTSSLATENTSSKPNAEVEHTDL